MSAKENVKGELITLSRSDSQVLPIKAIKGGEYISAHSGRFIVEFKGLFQRDQPTHPKFEGMLKESDIIFSRFVYVGTVYPDQTCVPFIPVADATISSGSCFNRNDRNRHGYEDQRKDKNGCHEVCMTVPSEVWKSVASRLHGSFSRLRVRTEGVKERENTKYTDVKCKLENEDVVRVCLNGMWFDKKD